MSRFASLLVVIAVVGVACQPKVTPPSPPPPPPPPPPNHPPVAVVGGPYASADGTVSFDGSGSSDPDGDALTYAWSFGDGSSGAGVKPSHTYTTNGDYNVSLVVKDTHDASSAPATTLARVTRPAPSVTFVGAGNIGACRVPYDDRTADRILQMSGAVVFTLGDNAFESGTDSEYENCYGPSWGRFKAQTHPTLGNHEYEMGNANGAFDYFGAALGARNKGWYSYDIGAWHVIVLNDNEPYVDFDPGSEQAQWLANDLATKSKPCTIAMWHVPLFQSSNTSGFTMSLGRKPLWDALYEKGVDIVLNAQPHHYERLKPMTPSGQVDEATGIREFIVGTGGGGGTSLPTRSIHPNSVVRGDAYGVLKLSLRDGGYDWQFVAVEGETFNDAGSGSCH
jgi:acid phosphatase type 7